MSKLSLSQAIACRFAHESIDREALESYCAILGMEKPHHRKGHDKIVAEILEHLGMGSQVVELSEEGTPAQIEHVDAEPMDNLAFMNNVTSAPALKVHDSGLSVQELWALSLVPHSKWAGRRRRITLSRPHGTPPTSTYPYFFGWGGMTVYVPYDVPSDIPWPIYEILNDTKARIVDLIQDTKKDGELYTRPEWRTMPQIPFADMGDTPGTEHLPRSQIEQFQEIFSKLNFLKDVKYSALTAIASRLRVSTVDNAQNRKPLSTDELVDRLLEKVHLPSGLNRAA